MVPYRKSLRAPPEASPPSNWAPFNSPGDFTKNMGIVLAALIVALALALSSGALIRRYLLFLRRRHLTEKPICDKASPKSPEYLSAVRFSAGEGIPVTECAVCLIELADGDFVRVMPHCRHQFHARCIDAWISISGRRSCPNCRKSCLPSSPPADGFTGIKSLTADKIFDKYFPSNEIASFEEFHRKFLQLCSDFNSVMLGKHYKPPSNEDIEKCYELWVKDDANKKQLMADLLSKNVKEIKTADAIILTGLVVPPASMVLKKASQNVPQLKPFRFVPDVVFVPSLTIAALFGVKALHVLNLGSKR